MLSILCFLIYVLSLLPSIPAKSSLPVTFDHFIIGGDKVPKGEGNSVVRLQFYHIRDPETGIMSQGLFCTGVLISPKVILTAGHCLVRKPSYVEVGYGGRKIAENKLVVARKWHAHPSWASPRSRNDPASNCSDLAVIILDDPIDLSISEVEVMKLYEDDGRPDGVLEAITDDVYLKELERRYLTIYGWGRIGNHTNFYETDTMHKLDNQTLTNSDFSYSNPHDRGALWIKGRPETIAWKGDSGGPLVEASSGTLVGIASGTENTCSCSGRIIPKEGGVTKYCAVRINRDWIQKFIDYPDGFK